ncbi:4'-phosphopantetheinyl transferase family protein [Geodermatophilus obscurus]|uniref:4'-phosphopantetheinyl transferase n=1 Tax=Geodermatophilus obscurus (strain ATCC 25078 / DSM 43160 / JCM 3152 / CCUG 61914 / KCC A-0152 / KCTC 9177 / NBRC 13315 / NRRL B-3577 / G-20) TaxID=526225 RepID=D2S609_GEOOG|nr:4'-phosphopantetheinyl transferase superfamily protein [Geodermatophilus obscurus]ADB73226.1 4'-phosphopantetheinyl transferase [Geodermatophilus obscurus DSM 43160]
MSSTAGPTAPTGVAGDLLLRLVDLTPGGRATGSARSSLTPAECAHADRGTAEVAARRLLLRAALRETLGAVLGLAPADVPLTLPPGRPELTGAAAGSGLDVSCSASAGLGVVAVASGARVGVDIERVRDLPLADTAAEGWLTAGEHAAVAALPAAQQPEVLTRCWTQKEAVLKGLGVGLRSHPATVVTPSAGRAPGRTGDWELRSIDLPEGWVGSVALRLTRPAAAAADPLGTP